MSKDYKKELNQMYHLMNYGLNESKQNGPFANAENKGILEYSQIGADGKTYGIVREGTKYFIKVAPKKHTKILTEDFDYVGGFNNRKPFNSYTKASQELNLKLISVNESMGSDKPVESQYKLNESAEWSTNTTKEARADLNRFYQLVSNVDKLLNENVHYIKENKNAPYTETGKANYNTKNGGGNKGTAGSPDQNLGIKEKSFTEGDNTSRPNKSQSDYQDAKGDFKVGKEHGFGDHNVDEDGGNAYQEKPTKMKTESRRAIKLSEEQQKQVLAWRDDRAFVHKSSDSELDTSKGTEIGDSAPFSETVNENLFEEDLDFVNENFGSDIEDSSENILGSDLEDNDESIYNHLDNFGEGEDSLGIDFSGDDDEFEDFEEDDFDLNSLNENFDIEDSSENILNNDLEDNDESIYNHLDNFGEGEDSLGIDFSGDDDEFDYEDDLDVLPETDSEPLYEVTLNDFGKHPAYKKQPMTLPTTGGDSKWGRDWNDDSVKSEAPFGTQIGHGGDLFNQQVEAITNAVVDFLTKSKKKV